MSIYINLIIAFVFVVIVEIVGICFFTYKINIDPSRLFAAHVVFQFAVATAVISMLTTPYDAIIIANERMKFYAYVSIIEGFGRLAVVLLLAYSPFDKLIYYAILLFCLQLLMRLINSTYCHKNFQESHFKRCWDKLLFKDMSSFAGWNFFGNAGYSITNEGINLVLNSFGGPLINAARGIAYQVRSAIEQFLNSVNKAIDPFSMKTYAKNNIHKFFEILYTTSKILFIIYICMITPVFLYTDEIIKIWLGTVPDYACIFIKILLVQGLIRSFLNPLDVLFYSANKLRYYQVRNLVIAVAQLFFAWLVLKLGFDYDAVFYVMLVAMIINYVTIIIQAHMLCGLPIIKYFRNVTLRCIVHFLCIASLVCAIPILDIDGLWYKIFVVILITLINMLIAYYLNFSKQERDMVWSILKNKKF